MPQSDFYSLAEYYDIAFDFRDMNKQCEFIEKLCRRHLGRLPDSAVELACGPGYHAIELSKRPHITRSLGIDLCPEMVEYARGKNSRMSGSAEFAVGDMREYDIGRPADVAICMLASFHHLLTNEDILANLRSTARNLSQGGLYVIECSHPSDAFTDNRTTQNVWDMERDGYSVFCRWGKPEDAFDPITQIDNVSVTMHVRGNGKDEAHDFIVQTRVLTWQEMKLLVSLSGVFDIVDCFGAVDVDQPFNTVKGAWRMVPVLRRR